jgi:BlaI family penicillinase repressor
LNKVVGKISESEWHIMSVLWDKSPLTSTNIIEAIKPHVRWNPKTIHTLISRLVDKGVLGVNKDTSPHQFYPLVSREESVRYETKSFMKKFYSDSLSLMVANFIKDDKISEAEIEELKRILEDRSDDAKRK